jgi:hypothetical protein
VPWSTALDRAVAGLAEALHALVSGHGSPCHSGFGRSRSVLERLKNGLGASVPRSGQLLVEQLIHLRGPTSPAAYRQHILLTRTPAITGRYEFLSFDTPAGGRAWLTELLDKVQSAADVQATVDSSDRWVTLAFTWNGLRALGVPEESLATFPDEFREGMAARADILGDTTR